MNHSLTETQFRSVAVCAVIVLAFLAYANTFGGEFVWDDASSVLLHKHVQDPGTFLQLFREDQHPFGRGQGNFYRPLVTASFMLDYAVSRPSSAPPPVGKTGPDISPFVFHVTNLGWHIVAALAWFAFMTRLGAPRLVRFATAVLYVVHPLHTEAVAYISGRADPMSAAFVFAALCFALWNGAPEKRILGTALCAASFALALISKESAVVTPFLLLLLVATARLRRADAKAGGHPWASFAVTTVMLAGYAALRATVLNFGGTSQQRALGLGARLVEVGQAFALYIRLIFVPTGLHMERTLDGVPLWVAGAGYAALALCIVLVVAGYAKGQWRLATGMALFLVTWFPVSGVFPLNAPMAEHWMYVPLAAFLWSIMELVCLVARGPASRTVAHTLVYAACALFVALTAHRDLAWRSNESLYVDTLEKNPYSGRVEFNLAVTYGDLLNKPVAARRHYERVLQLYTAMKSQGAEGPGAMNNEELESHFSLGRLYVRDQRFERAGPHFAAVLGVTPTDENKWMMGPAALGLSQCLANMGRMDEARKCLEKAATLAPELKPEIERLLHALPAATAS